MIIILFLPWIATIGKKGALDDVGVTNASPINNARLKCSAQSATIVSVFQLFKTSSLSPLILLVWGETAEVL